MVHLVRIFRPFWPWGKQSFTRVPTSPSEDDEEKFYEPTRQQRSTKIIRTLAFLFGATGVAVLSGSVGVYIGKYDNKEAYKNGLLETAGTIPSKMIWNSSFSFLNHEQQSTKAWNSLFPDGMGLVTHPILAPDVSALAVYHQLHCLQVIYENYKKAISTQSVNQSRSQKRNHGPLLNVHTEHCFDYLRQAIFCAADTTLEEVNPELYGEKTALPKKCRNMNKVAEWAAEWKTNKAQRDLHSRFGFVRELEKLVYQGSDHVAH